MTRYNRIIRRRRQYYKRIRVINFNYDFKKRVYIIDKIVNTSILMLNERILDLVVNLLKVYNVPFRFRLQERLKILFKSTYRNFTITAVRPSQKPMVYKTIKSILRQKARMGRREGWSRLGYYVARRLIRLRLMRCLMVWYGSNIRINRVIVELQKHYFQLTGTVLRWNYLLIVPRLSYGFTRGKKYPRRKRKVRKQIIRRFNRMM